MTQPAANSPRTSNRWLNLACAGLIGVLALICIILLPIAYFFITRNAPQVTGPVASSPAATSPGATTQETAAPATTSVIATTLALLPAPSPEPLLNPDDYARSSRSLADAVGNLNISELDFIHAAQNSGGRAPRALLVLWSHLPFAAGDLDLKLRQVAANAQRVATLADRLSRTAASQSGGSDSAGLVAGQYRSVAQVSAALVLVSQNLRDNLVPPTAAAEIALYGARLWNPALTDPATGENPFTAFLTDPASVPPATYLSPDAADALAQQLGGEPTAWLAASADPITQNLAVPNLDLSSLGPPDPTTAANMETAEGQNDPQTARSVAASIILAGSPTLPAGAPAPNGEVVAAFNRTTAVSEPDETPSRAVAQPAFPGGHVSAVTKAGTPAQVIEHPANVDQNLVTNLLEPLPVVQTNPVVAITISNLVITAINKRPKDAFNTFEADVVYEFDVQWTASLSSPQFALDCVGGNHFDITSAAGTQHVIAKGLLILYPGAEDAFCYASRNGSTLGSASVHFLVGDAAQATQRAIQVETDSVALDLALTADVFATRDAIKTLEAATEAVLGTQHALETEVIGTQTAEFRATITEIARQTERAVPAVTETPSPTPTFEPLLVDSLFHPGNVFAVNSSAVLQTGRLYRLCFGGTVNLTSGPAKPSEIEHANGISVPGSGCLTLQGTGAVATFSCGQGEPDADNPGGFSIQIFDLGPKPVP